MEAVVVVLLLGFVVWVVGTPLRREVAERETAAAEGARADLEAEKASKYREIRDAEVDRRMGKLSDEDWRALDRQLRAEAMDILHAIDALEGS